MRLAVSLGVVAVVSAWGQLSVGTPSLGVIADASGGLVRPVLGIRGFPGVGAPVSLVEDATRTLLASRAGFALVESTEGWRIVTLHGAERSVRSLAVPRGKVTLASLSPSGRSAVFYFEEQHRIHAVTGLPDAPRESFSLQLSARSPRALAINDAGDLALAGIAGDGGSILVLRRDTPETIGAAVDPVAIAFVGSTSRAIVADRGRNEILSVEIAASGSAVQVLAAEDAGIMKPVDIAVDESTGRVLILNAGSRTILDLSLTGEASRKVECSFEPAHIAALRERRQYAVFSSEPNARWLLRLDPEGPQLSYLPSVE